MTDCIEWDGAKNDKGYGQVCDKGKVRYVHRMAYEQAYGAIPDGYEIDHICHNPSCYNPDHLRAVTPSQNQQNRKGANCNSRTGVKGVSWSKSNRKYIAQIMFDGVRYHLGSFVDVELAELALRTKKAELKIVSEI